ncbi:hypothetical protein HDU92_000200 [Lobulomyces angularis]|nr:hypothetical protein HDU92_000200 [Lobulomyces angularis]
MKRVNNPFAIPKTNEQNNAYSFDSDCESDCSYNSACNDNFNDEAENEFIFSKCLPESTDEPYPNPKKLKKDFDIFKKVKSQLYNKKDFSIKTNLAITSHSKCFIKIIDQNLWTGIRKIDYSVLPQHWKNILSYYIHPSKCFSKSQEKQLIKILNGNLKDDEELKYYIDLEQDCILFNKELDIQYAYLSKTSLGLRKLIGSSGANFELVFSEKAKNISKDIYQPGQFPIKVVGVKNLGLLKEMLLKYKEPRIEFRVKGYPLLISSTPFINSTHKINNVIIGTILTSTDINRTHLRECYSHTFSGYILPTAAELILQEFEKLAKIEADNQKPGDKEEYDCILDSKSYNESTYFKFP